jgi:GNAT superfamily N-acetyltransferase
MTIADCVISADKSMLSLDRICALLNRSYWASQRSREAIERSIATSQYCVGAYVNGEQVGFVRIVTDFVAMYWIGDLFVDPVYRRHGLGKKLIQYIVAIPELQGLNGILSTRDAHEFFHDFGFSPTGLLMMRLSKE